MEFSNFKPEIIVSSSRLVQESINVSRGISVYGTLASFIDCNIAKIDALAEYIGDTLAQNEIKNKYDKQYFNENQKFKSFLTRNIYLNADKKQRMEDERFIYGGITRAAVELAIKCGARAIEKAASDKDKFIICEQVYAILVSYIQNAPANTNKKRAVIELNKIRNSFPLSKFEKNRLMKKYASFDTPMTMIDVSSVTYSENSAVKNSLAYFISVICRILYGENISEDKEIFNYYSLIDINGVEAKNIQAENQAAYADIAADQLAYLEMSRGFLSNIIITAPNIDIDGIKRRTRELAQYDPYAIRRKKLKGVTQNGAVKISSVLAKYPEIALNGISTAMAQFTPNDELLSSVKKAVGNLGICGNEFDVIAENANDINEQNQKNDLNEESEN